jgi:hypothetical protein
MADFLTKIEALASAATPGPWIAMPPPAPSHSDHGYRAITKPWRSRDPCGVYAIAANMVRPGEGFAWGADAEFIAAANPAAVLAMVAEHRAMDAVCRAAKELQACKALKDSRANMPKADDRQRATRVYELRKPAAWIALRSAIAALDALQDARNG